MVEEELGFPHPCWRMGSGNFPGRPEGYLPLVYLLASIIPHHGTQKWLIFCFWSFLIGLGFVFNSFCAVDKNHSLFSNLWIIVYGHCSCSPFVYWMTLEHGYCFQLVVIGDKIGATTNILVYIFSIALGIFVIGLVGHLLLNVKHQS